MESYAPLISLIFLFTVADGFLVFFFIRNQKKIAAIEGTPTTQIRHAKSGRIEVHGHARVGSTVLVSPFGEESCVYFDLKVQEYRRGSKSGYWRTIISKSSSGLFAVEDESGKILVNPDQAELMLKADHKFQNSFMYQQGDQEKLQRGLERVGVNEKGLFGFKRRLKCVETVIREGDELYVLGDADAPGTSGSSVSGDRELVIQKKPNALFLISDVSEEELLKKLKQNRIFQLVVLAALGVVFALVLIALIR